MIDSRNADYAVLLLRITMGGLFLAHAGFKLFVATPAGTEKFFASLGLPGWFGLFIIALEAIGGAALILGIATRVFSALLIGDLIGAIALVNIHKGFFFTAPGGGWEFPGLWAVALIVLALLGPGRFALLARL